VVPVIFIHGVNTRDGGGYRRDVAARDEMIRRLVLTPLAATKGDYYARMEVVNPYWGRYGVDFKWGHASLPVDGALEHLGVGTPGMVQSDLDLAVAMGRPGRFANTGYGIRPPLEALGIDHRTRKNVASGDVPRFVEAVLSPIILSDMTLASTGMTDEVAGTVEALLLVAGYEISTDPAVGASIAAAPTDQAAIDLIRHAVLRRFDQLLVEGDGVSLPTGVPPHDRLESLGPGWVDGVRVRIGELFDRAMGVAESIDPVRAFEVLRQGMHRSISAFLGDVFVYINERADRDSPGPIVAEVLRALETRKRDPREPRIVITHSMGGNILYDILTYYDPTMRVDAWISVGGQIGQFEEMKLFKASDPRIGTPDMVGGLKPALGYWLNAYDPLDILAFRAMPIFADVDDDVPFLTGAGAIGSHGAYFRRPRFFEMMRTHLERALR